MALGLLVAGCSHHPAPQVPYGEEIRLEPIVDGQQWYRASASCAQGPYELEVPATGARWGEEVELRVHTPRKIALHAVIMLDDKLGATADAVFDDTGATGGAADNARCVATVQERLALGRPTGGGAGGPPGGATGEVGVAQPPPPPPPSVTARLDIDEGVVTSSGEILKLRLPELPPGAPLPRIRIKLWSIEPNDLDGVRFGLAHISWRPNVPEEQYEAWLRAQEERAREQERVRIAEQQRAEEQWRRTHPPEVKRVVVVRVDYEAERRREEERRRKREIEIALEMDRRARREKFCATHHEDRGCWGAGGFAMHLELERHQQERDAYCAEHAEDARCWTPEEWSKRRTKWDARVTEALAPKPPPGPPPAPLAEEIPPKLSLHAEWRPGYWQWTEATWVWLAGQWRVPDEDIVAEQTTTAPAAPPPPQAETPPPPPVHSAVWVAGFWQWSGSQWVWVAGSYQLRPAGRVTWRAPEWRPRGGVHVLIPGAWIKIGGGR